MSFTCWVTATCRSWLGHTDRSTNKAYKRGREEFCFDIQDLDCWGGLLPLFILRSTGMTSILQDAGIGKCNNRKWLQCFAFRPRAKANEVKTKILIQKIKKQNASRDFKINKHCIFQEPLSAYAAAVTAPKGKMLVYHEEAELMGSLPDGVLAWTTEEWQQKKKKKNNLGNRSQVFFSFF